MPNQIHVHLAKAYAHDRRRSLNRAHANRAIGRPPNRRRIAQAGARATARIAVRIDREAARRAIA